MKKFVNLKGSLREFWDENITRELTTAGIKIHPIANCDSPRYHGVASISGRLEQWIFSRDAVSYSFWGDIPLTMAQRVASDTACREGSIPKQWLNCWEEPVDPKAENKLVAGRTVWIAPDGYEQYQDHGYSDEYMDVMIREKNGRLRYMTDPSLGASEFVQTYTFFTQAALNRFIEISNEERVPYKYTR